MTRSGVFDFLCAINETVKKGDVVVDAGSGSGILGLFAAKAGAKRVFCIESNPRFLEIIKGNGLLKDDKPISGKVVFDQPNFYVDEPLEINKRVTATAKRSGVVNAVRRETTAGAGVALTGIEPVFQP